MADRAGTGRPHGDAARIGAGEFNQFAKRAIGALAIHHQQDAAHRNARDGRQIAHRIKRHLRAIQILVRHQHIGGGEQQRMPILLGLRDGQSTQITASAGAVFHHHGLTQNGGQAFGNHARDNVIGATRRDWHNQPHRAGWEILRLCGAGGEDGAGTNQRGATGKAHGGTSGLRQ